MSAPKKVSLEEIKQDCVTVSGRWPKDSLNLAVLTRDGADTEYLVGGPALAKVLAQMAEAVDFPFMRTAITVSKLSEIDKYKEDADALGHLIICEEEEDFTGTALLALVSQKRAQGLVRIGFEFPRT